PCRPPTSTPFPYTTLFRSLTILEQAGLIELGPTPSSVYTSVKDVVANPKDLDFRELDATLIAKTLDDLDIGFLYSSGAKNNGFKDRKSTRLNSSHVKISYA